MLSLILLEHKRNTMKKASIFLTLPFLFIQCAQDNSKKEGVVTRREHVSVVGATAAFDPSTVQANAETQIQVSGMVCKMGCGSTIKKELLETQAVKKVEIDFAEDRKLNTIKVAYDNTKIDEASLVQHIERLNNKQFTATINQ